MHWRNIALLVAGAVLAPASRPAMAHQPGKPGGVQARRIPKKATAEGRGAPLAPRPASGDSEKTPGKFVRLRRDAAGRPLALETAVVGYTAASGLWRGVRVDLIGAVHVGEKEYYEQLNRRFRSYDALLYELVLPEGSGPPSPGAASGGANVVSAMQVGMKSLLGLEFQLDCVDYSRPNFVHADLSRDEFAKSMKDRGESFFQLFLRMMGQAIAAQSNDPGRVTDLRLLMALLSKDRARRLKEIMAEEFENLESDLNVLDGPNGSTIITERNKRALDVLSDAMRSGKKRIGIFYGAGHLPDMERRLCKDFGFREVDRRWLAAWRLADGKRGQAGGLDGSRK
jgi:hypothetical protein